MISRIRDHDPPIPESANLPTDVKERIRSSTRCYAIIGHPVGHSLSPFIHNFGFAYHGLDAVYLSFDVQTDSLGQAVAGAKAFGLSGFNVTSPHKVSILELLDELSPESKTLGAVNTVVHAEGRHVGHNTDKAGFAAAISPWRRSFEGQRALVIGAGGSARAVILGLLDDYRVSQVTVATRRRGAAETLATELCKVRKSAEVICESMEDSPAGSFPVVVNCTPPWHNPGPEILNWLSSALDKNTIAMDLCYGPVATPFLMVAGEVGCTAIDGIDMLLYQAAESFRLWTGRALPVDEIRLRMSSQSGRHAY